MVVLNIVEFCYVGMLWCSALVPVPDTARDVLLDGVPDCDGVPVAVIVSTDSSRPTVVSGGSTGNCLLLNVSWVTGHTKMLRLSRESSSPSAPRGAPLWGPSMELTVEVSVGREKRRGRIPGGGALLEWARVTFVRYDDRGVTLEADCWGNALLKGVAVYPLPDRVTWHMRSPGEHLWTLVGETVPVQGADGVVSVRRYLDREGSTRFNFTLSFDFPVPPSASSSELEILVSSFSSSAVRERTMFLPQKTPLDLFFLAALVGDTLVPLSILLTLFALFVWSGGPQRAELYLARKKRL